MGDTKYYILATIFLISLAASVIIKRYFEELIPFFMWIIFYIAIFFVFFTSNLESLKDLFIISMIFSIIV